MSTSSISRRYAQAIFDIANEADAKLKASIHEGVDALAAISTDVQMYDLLTNPRVSATQQVAVLSAAVGGLPGELERLCSLLCHRGKSILLPEISEIYNEMRREADAVVMVNVSAATPLDNATQKELAAAISLETGKQACLSTDVDESLIGGMVVRIGDRRIDCSLRGKLAGLRRAIAA
ncbi:MAG: F0F1 ATP synthase subunit delta [Mariprofundales bacterium]